MKNKFIKILNGVKSPIFLLLLFTIIVRLYFFDVIGIDYKNCLHEWYEKVIEYGGISSLKYTIGNYPDTYMFLLAIGTYITKNSLIYIKLLSVIFDYIMGLYIYKIYTHFRVDKSKMKSLVALLLPGVFINSAVLGQCDAIYTAFLIMFIYYILKNKPKIALTLYGVALSFKIQALFLAPIMLYLLLTKRIKIRDLVFCIIGFIIFFIPTILFGKGLFENLLILLTQTSTYNHFVGSCANIYSLLLLNYVDINFIFKLVLSFIVVIFTAIIVYVGNKEKFEEKTFLKKVMFLSVFVPFCLPSMLDRYFYVANLLIYLYYTIYENKNSSKFIILSSIAYPLPVISINFFDFNIIIDWIFVSIISAPISLWLIYSIYLNLKEKNIKMK